MSEVESKTGAKTSEKVQEDAAQETRFSPEEERALLDESHQKKSDGNQLFGKSAFSEAIGEYEKALSSCPTYLDYEVAVLKSNIAACHIKLQEWTEAVESATKALSRLDKLASPKETSSTSDALKGQSSATDTPEQAMRVVELESDDEAAQEALDSLQKDDEAKERTKALRAKSLMRRARANKELGGWANLASAESDYKEVLQLKVVPVPDQKFISGQLKELGTLVSAAKEKEMAEMMGKLKELGNGILKPFGLSTDMFKFQQDEKTGGYNMSFGNGESST